MQAFRLPPAAQRAAHARAVIDGYRLPRPDRVGFVDRMMELAVHAARHEAVVYAVTPNLSTPSLPAATR